MFRRGSEAKAQAIQPIERVTSVLGNGISWSGGLRGRGGVRIEGIFEGQIQLRGLLVVGETGRVTCNEVQANTVIVAGAVRGNITAEKLEIRSSGRVWGDVRTVAFSTEEGAFLRGQVTMEERVTLDFGEEEGKTEEKGEPEKAEEGQEKGKKPAQPTP